MYWHDVSKVSAQWFRSLGAFPRLVPGITWPAREPWGPARRRRSRRRGPAHVRRSRGRGKDAGMLRATPIETIQDQNWAWRAWTKCEVSGSARSASGFVRARLHRRRCRPGARRIPQKRDPGGIQPGPGSQDFGCGAKKTTGPFLCSGDPNVWFSGRGAQTGHPSSRAPCGAPGRSVRAEPPSELPARTSLSAREIDYRKEGSTVNRRKTGAKEFEANRSVNDVSL
jgi:hypothetical protein